MYRIITLILLFGGQLIPINADGQKSFTLGIGINSALSIQPEDEKPYVGQDVPPWLISPNITIKSKKSEFVLSPDLFLTSYSLLSSKYYFILSGGHFDYKYHFLNARKVNWFLSSTILYNQFLNGTPITGYDANPSLGSHSVYLKTKTIGGTLGAGINLNLFYRLDLFAVVNAGMTYSYFEVLVDYDWREYKDQTKFNLIGQFRLGLTMDIYRAKP